VSFEQELSKYLPADLPERDRVITLSARHLDLIREMNQVMNLTRILDEKEAAIKHVCDSVQPWRLFAGQTSIVDAGTGAGFPGLPLAFAFPERKFTLCESIQKKARFVASVVETLGLSNVSVVPIRIEEWLRANPAPLVTARAVASISKMVGLLAPALRKGTRLLLYKGPDVENEIAEAWDAAKAKGIQMTIAMRYELPEQSGSRSIVELLGLR
jgi:16S rRNA (guanine527-N7)-methyltransferase